MTLLITVFAAAVATILWYNSKADRKLGTLALMYWGASLMWLVDSVVEFLFHHRCSLFGRSYLLLLLRPEPSQV